MIKIKHICILILAFILIFLNLYNPSYAVVSITEGNLKTALQKYMNYGDNNSQITIANNVITITEDGETYNINYDLTNQPTFTMEVNIQKGMSYEKWSKQSNNFYSTLLGYILIANIQGIEFDDISTYLLLSMIEGTTASPDYNKYVIVDDTKLSEGVTIDKDPNDTRTIYVSEFGDRVLEYVNSLYKNKYVIKDNFLNGINSYEWSLERKEVTDTSCKLVSMVKVNTNADFSKLQGYKNIFDNPDDENVGGITESNADYVLKLKVGQQCKIESLERIAGHYLIGDSIEFNEDNTEIIATKVGVSTGHIYIGNTDTKKTFYITVEENVGNMVLETITLNIDNKVVNNTPTTIIEEKPSPITQVQKPTQNNEERLPQTGTTLTIIIVIGIVAIISIIVGLKLRKYNDIK